MRGGLVDHAGACVATIDAAVSGNEPQYCKDASGNWVQFIADNFALPGDTWNGTAWTYHAVAPSGLTYRQVTASLNESGFAATLATKLASATQAEINLWTPANFSAADTVFGSLGLTATQAAQVLRQAAQYPA